MRTRNWILQARQAGLRPEHVTEAVKRAHPLTLTERRTLVWQLDVDGVRYAVSPVLVRALNLVLAAVPKITPEDMSAGGKGRLLVTLGFTVLWCQDGEEIPLQTDRGGSDGAAP